MAHDSVQIPQLLRSRLKRTNLRNRGAILPLGSSESMSSIPSLELIRQQSTASDTVLEEPTQDELLALTHECFPPIEESRVIITEYSANAVRKMQYTLQEVLASKCILQPGDLVPRVRWIYVEYHKMGTFWGSDYRCSQWGTDPALFEKSPIVLLQDRLAELDREAGRPPLEEDLHGKRRKFAHCDF